MAFGKKYYSSYKSNNNLDYYLEIFVEDYSSTSSELTMGAGGPVIEYETDQEDRFSPIISSSCKIPFLVKDSTDATFIDSLRTTYQERQIYVHLYRSDSSGYSSVSPLWSGFLVMDLGKGVDQSFPYVQELKFVDGLALLKDIDFVDFSDPNYEDRVQGNYVRENMYYGPGTYIFWIREILLKSGAALTTQGATQNYRFTTSVNWYNGDMDSAGQSDDPLQKTKCQVSMFHRKDDKDVYFPDNCYNVLKELLRHWGARITYWKHQFWIVQIPEYITGESGTIDNPQNNNSRVYTYTGSLQGTQDHLGSTYWTRYFQEISNTKISKLSGTTYDYLPIIKQVNADFLSFASKSYFGGLPFGSTAPTQEVFQGTINTPSAADFLFLSIPLDWQWDLSSAPTFPSGHTNGWWASIKFNFYASDGSTTYYLQYNSQSQTLPYYWVDSASWQPLGNRSPKYTISSKQITVNGHVGFEEQIPFKDANGNAIVMSGAWSFFLDIENYGNSSSNPGSFYLNFSGYGSPQRMRNPNNAIQLPLGSGNMSGTVSWSNTLQDPQGNVTISSVTNPAGFNAGTVANDIRFATTSPFLGLLQLMTNTQSAAFGESFNTLNTSSTAAQENSEQFDFGTLLWGDVTDEFARSSLQVYDGSTYENTNETGLWGRGTLLGTKTFTQLLIDEFLYGQTKIVITPNMRLAVGEANKDQTQGGVTRPRYVNPIGKLRETRDGADPEYFFRRGSFHTLLDEWDYEGYQILRNVVTTTTQTNGMGNLGGTQSNTPNQQAMIQNPVVQALAQNSPIAYLRQTVNATGSDVAVNGNFNVATGWTLGTGWTIDTTEKVAKFAATGSTSDLVQSVLTQELTYQVNFRVVVTAGTLTVKAGTSGDTQVISSSGDYSIYLTCEGSNDIKFQAGTTFTGNITFITLRDQKSLSSVPIEEIGSAVFKTGDTFNLINENQDEPLVLTVTADQGSTDTTISVSSTPLYEDITPNSYLLINQDDLSAQYQNKTKGTVGGFDITANSIDSGSVSIESYIDDDTFATASATSLATSESIKAYVDTQVGSADTLQEVTDNGNTTTNSIMIGSSSSPSEKLEVYSNGSNVAIKIHEDAGTHQAKLHLRRGGSDWEIINDNHLTIEGEDAERLRITAGTGNLLIGTTSDDGYKLNVNGTSSFFGNIRSGGGTLWSDSNGGVQLGYSSSDATGYLTTYYNTTSVVIGAGVSQKTGITINGQSASVGNKISFRVGNSERMRLTSGGNVGIGTANPSVPLEVYASGTDKLKLTDDDGSNVIFGIGGNLFSQDLSASAQYRIRINNSEKIRLDSAGNLGINTSFPSEKLHVVGDALITGDSHADAFKPAASGNPIKFKNFGSTELARFTDGGNLGIGTTSPSAKLQVDEYTVGSQGSQNIFGNLSSFSNSGSENLFLGIKDATYPNRGWAFNPVTNGVNSDLVIKEHGSSGERLRIKTGGNVLIGTTTDSGFKLRVNGDSTTGVVAFKNAANGRDTMRSENAAGTRTFNVGNDGSGHGIILLRNSSGTTTSYLSGSGVSYFNGGNVGIGTSSPSQKLQVQTANDTYAYYVSNSSGSNRGGLYVDAGGDTELKLRTGSGDMVSLKADGNSFINGGNLGINTSTPTEKLHVVGDALITGDSHADAFKPAVSGNPIKFKNFDSTERVQITNDGDLRITTPHTNGNYRQISWVNQYVGLYRYYNNLMLSGYDSIQFKVSGADIYSQAEKARITSGGNVLIGTTTDDGSNKLQVNGNVKLNDNFLYIGTGNDLRINHNGTDSFITNHTGDLKIINYADDKDIIFQSDDGAGGTETYFFLDGSISFGNPFTVFPDNSHLAFGDSQDLQIDHDGNHSVIYNKTGNLYISNDSNDGDIVLRSDNGSGGQTAYITLDGSQTTVNVSQNLLINTTTDVGVPLYVNGVIRAVGGGIQAAQDYGFTLNDESGNNRYGLKFGAAGVTGGSNLLMLTNRSFNSATGGGEVAIGGNTNTSGVTEVEIARFIPRVTATSGTQKKVSLDAVLELTEQTAPANPASGESIIWMDSSSGDLKVKINYGGTTVTRTLASFE